MLYLSRKTGEAIIINNAIEITVVEVKGRSVKLGVTFPPEATVLRKELHERIRQENQAAGMAGESFGDADFGEIELGLGADEGGGEK